MIPTPEELAKRVLDALTLGSAVFYNLDFRTTAAELKSARDELAALLTPKEAT